jgi:predicted ester cyclase
MVEKVFNEGRLELLQQLMTPDAVDHGLEGFDTSGERGPAPVTRFLRAFRFAFPDLRVTVIDQLADGDRVATRWRMEGTQNNRLMSIAPSRRFVRVEGIRIDRIVNGKIAETWNQWDTLGMLRQIGAVQALDRRAAR